jgi:chromosome partitioning protein
MIGATPVERAGQQHADRASRPSYESYLTCQPSKAIVITDDFVSSGRISGAESIPIARLKIGKFHTVGGRRLQVNDSVTRYQRELAYLASII